MSKENTQHEEPTNDCISQLAALGIQAELWRQSDGQLCCTVKSVTGNSSFSATLLPSYLEEVRARRARGRYEMEEAAQLIAMRANANAASLLDKIIADANARSLPCYFLDSNERWAPSEQRRLVSYVLHQLHWDELNSWLEKNEPRLFAEFQFPPPSLVQSASPEVSAEEDEAPPKEDKPSQLPGVSKKRILAAGWPLTEECKRNDSLKNAMGDVPQWLESAITQKGAPGRGKGSHLWNPAMLAFCLIYHRWTANKRAVQRIMEENFSDYLDEWEELKERL